MQDARRRRVSIPETEIEISLLDWGGEGPLAFLHHANGFCADVWGPVAERLCSRYRVVAMDARGHGRSTSPDGEEAYHWPRLAEDLAAAATATLAEIGSARVALGIGHSFGGTLTLAAAARHPRLFERILLIDPVILPPEIVNAPERKARSSSMVERARKRRHDWSSRAEARTWFAERELFADWTPAALDAYVQGGLRERRDGQVELRCRGEVEATIFATGHTLNPYAEAERVGIPVRILRATRGDFPRQAYEALADRLAEASVEDVESGHLVPMEHPDRVVEAAFAFGPA